MKQTILVVDDEADVIRMITLILEDADYQVLSVNRGEDAIKLLASQAVDLIVTDIIMPDMEGIEFIQSVKGSHPTLPIVAISGGGRSHNADFLKFARKLGARATLPKPFRREELLAAVSKILAPAATSPA
jgi:CheY-like chemotaxis protein